jgi:hypothetical protein
MSFHPQIRLKAPLSRNGSVAGPAAIKQPSASGVVAFPCLLKRPHKSLSRPHTAPCGCVLHCCAYLCLDSTTPSPHPATTLWQMHCSTHTSGPQQRWAATAMWKLCGSVLPRCSATSVLVCGRCDISTAVSTSLWKRQPILQRRQGTICATAEFALLESTRSTR